MNYYLIPANSKKSANILGVFTKLDLVLFLIGVGLTLILMFSVKTESFVGIMLILTPAIIASFLVFPIPNYHNVLQLLTNIYIFVFVSQKQYKWRGWCFKNGNNK